MPKPKKHSEDALSHGNSSRGGKKEEDPREVEETKRSRRNRTSLVDFRRKVSRQNAAEKRGGVKVDAARRKSECVIRQRLTLFKGAAGERASACTPSAPRLAFAFCTRRLFVLPRTGDRSLVRSRGRCAGDGMDSRLSVQPRGNQSG